MARNYAYLARKIYLPPCNPKIIYFCKLRPKRAWNYAYLACKIQNFLRPHQGASPLDPRTENPEWIIWLIWAIVCHYTDDSFFTHFWVILSVYWPTMAQMSQMIHSGFSVRERLAQALGLFASLAVVWAPLPPMLKIFLSLWSLCWKCCFCIEKHNPFWGLRPLDPTPHSSRILRASIFCTLRRRFLINGAPSHPMPKGTLKQSYATGFWFILQVWFCLFSVSAQRWQPYRTRWNSTRAPQYPFLILLKV